VDAASGEITGAVVGSTLTTVLVFLPLAFIVGVYGQFFASLAWALAIAVLVSMVISLTLIPVFASKFLAGRPMPAPGRIYGFFAHIYEVALGGALRFPWLTLALSSLVMLFGGVLYLGISDPRPSNDPKNPRPPLIQPLKTGLMPAMDEGAFVIDYWLPSGTTLRETERTARDIEKILAEHPDVKAWVRRSGAELGLFATQTSRGDIQVVLRPAEEEVGNYFTRKKERPPLEELEKEMKQKGKELAQKKYGAGFTEEQARDKGKEWVREKYRRRPLAQIMAEVEDKIKDGYGEHQLKFETVQIMQDELNDLSGANKPIEIKIFGPDHTQLRAIAADVGERFEKLKAQGKGRGIKEINTNVRQGNPDLVIDLDSFELTRLGLDRTAVARQLKTIFQGDVALEIPEAQRLTGVRVRYSDEERFGKDRFSHDLLLDKLIVLPESKATPAAASSPASRTKPLSALLRKNRLSPQRTAEEQYRENQQPAIFVTAELEEDASLDSVVTEVRDTMAAVPLPADYRWEMGGHYLRYQEAKTSFIFIMVVAVVLVFIMLAFQFGSVVLPVLIFLTQPLSVVAGFFALWVTDTPLNVSSMMGIILLIGLDMKNGIILVEYIQQLRKEGMELRPALLEAGRVRFRPILMTSLAAILGLFPLALGIGPGAQMQKPLAIMVIGGLTANMLFTRMVIPVGYMAPRFAVWLFLFWIAVALASWLAGYLMLGVLMWRVLLAIAVCLVTLLTWCLRASIVVP
jgi:multidrug efflux pump subunit AcrB